MSAQTQVIAIGQEFLISREDAEQIIQAARTTGPDAPDTVTIDARGMKFASASSLHELAIQLDRAYPGATVQVINDATGEIEQAVAEHRGAGRG